MQAQVYETVEQVHYAVTKGKAVGCIPANTAVIGVQGSTREKAVMALNDWCYNNNVSPDLFKIKMGYIPGKVTNDVVYHSNDWLASKSTEDMRRNMMPPTTLATIWANNAR